MLEEERKKWEVRGRTRGRVKDKMGGERKNKGNGKGRNGRGEEEQGEG